MEVVKVIAPIALQALAAAAENLLAGEATRDAVERLPQKRPAVADEDFGDIITTDTWQYCESNFAAQYGYYYQGLRSQPTTGDLPVAAAEDIIVWEKKNGISDIQRYLQTVFKDSLNPADSIELANNLGSLFQQRFQEEALDWTPFSKRYNFPDALIVDVYMVTASARDVNNQPAGIASYCFVAYNHAHG
ncbi:hypothetical protein N869_13780 [Cellulomonas bogoriensis 69B4 = DSM 16987]|uniref:Uncharacterized protein n=1 Tax=Cellulomonas bogoriensis 69B4 = DSM 16987 TaxID=1386082 RepID=A0A0A0BYI1_9CELL|nr:hypothetical protein N869_13780 [Cellulomonas bogoriensis 69B4 = DSM 16987]